MQLVHSGFFVVKLHTFFYGDHYKNRIRKGSQFRCKTKVGNSWGLGGDLQRTPLNRNSREFGGGGSKVKNLPWWSMGIFWNHTINNCKVEGSSQLARNYNGTQKNKKIDLLLFSSRRAVNKWKLLQAFYSCTYVPLIQYHAKLSCQSSPFVGRIFQGPLRQISSGWPCCKIKMHKFFIICFTNLLNQTSDSMKQAK